ncbi:MAG: T9SS type A sorting domain-containing protein, partial [Saprospiraceae bacterium]|nr:T9SS type A sorting domain-containing protein [Saprospiraceae bacterium]
SDTTGSISLNVENATAPVSYAWSNGDTTSTILNLPAGGYSVTITDGAGCTATQAFTINEPDALSITVDTIIDINVPVNEGSVQVTIGGGTPAYVYLWTLPDGSQITTEDLTLLTQQGFYTLIVSDQNQCTATVTVLVDIALAVNPGLEFKPLKVYPVPTGDVLHIDSDLQMTEVTIMGVDGRLLKQFKNPASNNLQVADLEPGWYFLNMTDGESWYVARMVK